MQSGDVVVGSVPIGVPISNTCVVIVDASGSPVPDGAPGELWIGGDGLARGYAGDPELTSRRFIASPFGDALGERLYRSGDRVRRRSDGAIEFLGRVDRQVKIRGYRVDPSEAEAALIGIDGVAQVLVRPMDFGRDDKRLVAYLVPTAPSSRSEVAETEQTVDRSHGTSISDREIRGHLAGALPRYLIPSVFIWLDEMPLTKNGKVDMEALPDPPSTWFIFDEEGNLTPESNIERPLRGASKLEGTLLSIWQEVLGVRTIGIEDDFFDLGGHSLMAVELFAAIERTIGARLPLGTIFEAPTISKMASALRSDGWSGSTDSLVPLSTSGSRAPIFAVTAGDGNVVGFGPLAKRLGPDQPFYVLQPFGMYGTRPLRRTVRSIARHYVSKIREVQPHGPYALLGRCHGALVAYEMTHQLELAGESVSYLGVIDSHGPNWRTRRLANGLVYDSIMNMALEQSELDFGDIFQSVDAAERFTTWLKEPASQGSGASVNRYVYTAYLLRPDVQKTFPLADEDSGYDMHFELNRWAGTYGTVEMGIQQVFAPEAGPLTYKPVDPASGRSRRARLAARALDWLNFLTAGRFYSLASNRVDEIRRIAQDNVVDYRAEPISAPVTLFLSEESLEYSLLPPQIARWKGLETGGFAFEQIGGSHANVLREPSVRSLAEILEEGLDSARRSGGEAAPRTAQDRG
jgi:thioesterase domain-containing protein/acyl carrier protein